MLAHQQLEHALIKERDFSLRALCLSGGGWRAALYHAGGLERLNELGVLSQITTISSVSGGSVVSAIIAEAVRRRHIVWPNGGPPIPIAGWREHVTQKVLETTARNLRTGVWLKRILWTGGDMVDQLAASYEKRISQARFSELAFPPRHIVSATDLPFASNWRFDSAAPAPFLRPRVGGYKAGWMDIPPDWNLAKAVAASSCFPPLFNPLKLKLNGDELTDGEYVLSDREDLIREIGLTDGGVYDNLGLEPVFESHGWILVSDGGASIAPTAIGWLGSKVLRYAAVQGSQGSAVRKRWLLDADQQGKIHAAYWGIHSWPGNYKPDLPGYSAEVARLAVRIRTDLDHFSDREAALLSSHGYYMANAAASLFLGPRKEGIAGLWANWVPPRFGTMDEARAASLAEKGASRKVRGRGWPIPKRRGNIFRFLST